MILTKKAALAAVTVLSLSLLVVSTHAKLTRPADELPLGIEIALKNPFYIPAASADERGMSAVVRTPLAENVSEHEAISAVKLVPVVDGEKVKVKVTALIGDSSDITSCRQWDTLTAIEIGTYVAGLDEEVSVEALNGHGVRFENGTLEFKVVPKRVFPQMPLWEAGGGGCGCAACGRLQCCPNPGQCIECNTCGSACCN